MAPFVAATPWCHFQVRLPRLPTRATGAPQAGHQEATEQRRERRKGRALAALVAAAGVLLSPEQGMCLPQLTSGESERSSIAEVLP
mmetsp:Transcript_51580/g.105950  ORF Transcript_51580/g.105950 Transcript_51580/m.105950 type:complete len:86 (+) Transcript_51580:10-267(+)